MKIALPTCIACITALSVSFAGLSGHTQNREVVLSINDPRPLSEAASQLEPILGIPISYEDAALVYSGDYARALDTDWGRKSAEHDPRFRATNPIGSIGGSLEVRFTIDASVSARQVLQGVVDQHKARGNPGEFTLLSNGNGFSIVPAAIRDTNGILMPEHSPLDSVISFPTAERTGAATLEMICQAVTAASGRKVNLGNVPLNLFFNTAVEVGADHQTARDVLLRTLRELHWNNGVRDVAIPKMSWQLLYGPARAMARTPSLADGLYFLNLHTVH